MAKIKRDPSGLIAQFIVDPLDRLQRKVPPAGFAVAVFKRFSEDRGPQYTVLLTYYGFFSLLAMLLVLGTVSATILANDPDIRQEVIESITSTLPVTGEAVATNVGRLHGSGIALAVGLLLVAWSGLGVVNQAQDAFNAMWGVPLHCGPNIWKRVTKSVTVLGVVGVVLVALTAGGPILSALSLGWFQTIFAGLGTVIINSAALLVCIKLLTNKTFEIRILLPGAIGGGLSLALLQFFGTWYMTKVLADADALYGTFAVAIALLIWIGLQARIILMANTINLVVAKHLWPRSLSGRNLTEADQAALSQQNHYSDPTQPCP